MLTKLSAAILSGFILSIMASPFMSFEKKTYDPYEQIIPIDSTLIQLEVRVLHSDSIINKYYIIK